MLETWHNGKRSRWLRMALLGVWCAALFGWRAEAGASSRLSRPETRPMTTENFAIADFDGDALPDFASVQPGAQFAARTSYWIRFDLSAGQQSSFAVSAPTGGLRIASRDVNGDSFLDLIVSTQLANEPVAVLLNDGRGNFRLADAAGFSPAIWEAPAEWRAGGLGGEVGAAALARVGWPGVLCGDAAAGQLRGIGEAAPDVTVRRRKFDFATGLRGRAPPRP